MSLLSSHELAVRPVHVPKAELVYLRHVLEASEGIGFLIAARGGHALLVAPRSLEAELDVFISDMQREIGLTLGEHPEHQEILDVAF